MPRLNSATGLDRGMEAWIILTARKNYWRIAPWMEPEDLIQDGYLVWARCRDHYPDIVARSHFMALVKTSFINHITSLARKKFRTPEELLVDSSILDLDGFPNSLSMACCQEGYLLCVAAQATFPIKAVLELLTTQRGMKLLRTFPQKRSEGLNRYLCRLIGIDAERFDLPALVEGYLSAA